MEHIKQVRLELGEVSASFDVKALLTSVPVDPSIQIVQQKVTQDPTLPQRTNMSIQQIVKLLEFCLKNTYFLFQGNYYEQVHGAAMGPRKPTHRDQYLHWDSNHIIIAKHSVYSTLAHRAKVVSSNQPCLMKELEHIKWALQACHVPTWSLNKF